MFALSFLEYLTTRRRIRWYPGILAFCLLLSACSTLRVNDEREIRAMPPTAPATIYVTDFQLAPENFQAESGMLPISSAFLGMPGDSLTRLFGVPQDNAARTRALVNLMSSTLIEDLANAGLNARHLPVGELLPKQGWLVRGAFVQVDEGNRLRRALIGFGSGATSLRVIVWISDLSQGSSGPFCEVDTSNHSSNEPGAAISFDPYVGAARYLLDGLDLDDNVMQTAAKIAADIAERSRTGKPPDTWKTKLRRFL